MKQAILIGLGLYIGYLQFEDDLVYWIPAWGKGFCFHAQKLTPEFATIPDRYR